MDVRRPALDLIPPLAELRERYAQTAQYLKILGQLCRIAEREAIERNDRRGLDPSRGGRPSEGISDTCPSRQRISDSRLWPHGHETRHDRGQSAKRPDQTPDDPHSGRLENNQPMGSGVP